jgi:hypothetical protein
VQDGVERGSRIGRGYEEILEGMTVGKIAFDELYTRGDELATAVTQVIEYNGIVAFGGQKDGDGAAHVSSTAGN